MRHKERDTAAATLSADYRVTSGRAPNATTADTQGRKITHQGADAGIDHCCLLLVKGVLYGSLIGQGGQTKPAI